MKPNKMYKLKRRVNTKNLDYYIENEYLEDDKEYLKELEDKFRLNGFINIKGRRL